MCALIQKQKGGGSYEAVVVKVAHTNPNCSENIDMEVKYAAEVLASPELYEEYVSQLGTVMVRRRG